jgi:hypothetical protein
MKTLLCFFIFVCSIGATLTAADKVIFSEAEVQAWINVQNALHPNDPPIKIQDLKFAVQTGPDYKEPEHFTPTQIKNFSPPPPPLPEGLQRASSGPLGPFKLRESWSDVLAVEDPTIESQNDLTIESEQPKKKLTYDDLKGAKFSFERNFKSDTDTWNVQAALILPLVWVHHVPAGEAGFTTYGLTPSANVNRVHNEGDESKNVEKLTLRAGGFATWYFRQPSWIDRVVIRGGFAYQTDSKFDSSIPAGELELEPRLWSSTRFGIGYRQILINRPLEERKDAKDNAILAYQARLRFRAEYGHFDMVDPTNPDIKTDEEFMHLGAKAGIEFDPLFCRNLTGSVDYSYLPSVVGPSGHNTLLQAELAYKLWERDDGGNGSLSLKYVKGGLDFDQEEVHTLYFGLSVLY